MSFNCLSCALVHTGLNRIGGVIDSVLASSVVDHGFEPWSDQTKDCNISICCFSDKYAALRSKSRPVGSESG